VASSRSGGETRPCQAGVVVMPESAPAEMRLSRISKLLVDRDEVTTDEALSRRRRYSVTLCCGADVAMSRTMQLAVLTAAETAHRCFPGAVTVHCDPAVGTAPCLPWPRLNQTFGQMLTNILGQDTVKVQPRSGSSGKVLLFGDAPVSPGAIRVTFDGWIAKVGPAATMPALPEREYCSLAGVVAAAIAVSELFSSFAEISVEATRRTVGFSLWRPDLDIGDPDALGVQVEFLPRNIWILGLGHLGNAYLWAMASLPYPEDGMGEVFLMDFDQVEPENTDTGVLFTPGDVGSYKTRVCNRWLAARGFRSRMVERYFDSNFRCREDEPRQAFCGFDNNPARRDLATARFLKVMENGLGGTVDNFDTVSFHTLPNPRPVEELWPDLSPEGQEQRRLRREELARENPAYSSIAGDPCGRAELAGKSVAVPFVGITAAALAVAEAVRLLHDGPAYTDIKLVLSDLGRRSANQANAYSVHDLIGLSYGDAVSFPMK
jgi:ThiF family